MFSTGGAIREARMAAGLSQAELARRAGTSQATVSAYESGRKRPSADTLDRILSAAGRRLDARPRSRPVVWVGEERLAHAGRTLEQVLDLAALLPTRHAETLAFPRMPTAQP